MLVVHVCVSPPPAANRAIKDSVATQNTVVPYRISKSICRFVTQTAKYTVPIVHIIQTLVFRIHVMCKIRRRNLAVTHVTNLSEHIKTVQHYRYDKKQSSHTHSHGLMEIKSFFFSSILLFFGGEQPSEAIIIAPTPFSSSPKTPSATVL